MSNKIIIVRRPDTHPKGAKTIAVWEYGKPVPAGVIIGKGTLIEIEDK